LIAIQIQVDGVGAPSTNATERTYSVERLADIERRLTKLEEHTGI